jgi:hypothetical protein
MPLSSVPQSLQLLKPLFRPLYLLLLLPTRWGPLVAVETHVAAQPLFGVEHLAAVLADVSAPWLCPVCRTAIWLVTGGRQGRRENRRMRFCLWPLVCPAFNSSSLTTLDKCSNMKAIPMYRAEVSSSVLKACSSLPQDRTEKLPRTLCEGTAGMGWEDSLTYHPPAMFSSFIGWGSL